MISSRYLLAFLFGCLTLSTESVAVSVAEETGFGLKLVTFCANNPNQPEVITGHISSQESEHLPFNMRQTIKRVGLNITCFMPSEQRDTFTLLAFYPETEPWRKTGFDTGITLTKESLEQYCTFIPREMRPWFSAFSRHPSAIFSKASPASSSDTETPYEYLDTSLDHIAVLARWILNKSESSSTDSSALLDQAKTTLHLLSCPEPGGICNQNIVDAMALHSTSSLGFNVLSACMWAAAVLDKPDLISWVMDEHYSEELKTLVTASAAGKMNPLHLSLLKLPHLFERLLSAYPNSDMRMQAVREKTHDDFNVLMMAVTERPEHVTTLLKHIPNSERKPLLQDTLPHESFSYTLLEQAIKAHPGNTELVKNLLDACPDEESKTALITRTPPDGWGASIMAARYNSETLKILFAHCPKPEHPQILKIRTSGGDNVLTMASACSPGAITIILDASPDEQTTSALLTNQGHLGCNALLKAVEHAPKYVSVLLQAATDEPTIATMLTTQDKDGQNALHRAISCRHPELVSKLLSASPGNNTTHTLLTAQDNAGNNALILALWYGYPELVERLLSACPDSTSADTQIPDARTQVLTAKNNDGENALRKAACFAPAQLIEQLVHELDALPDKSLTHQAAQLIDTDGRNAMMVAAQYNPEALKLLVQTCQGNRKSIRKMLAAREKNHGGWNVLEHAVGFHNTRHVLELLDCAHDLGVLEEESERVQRRALEYCNASALRYMKSRKYALQPARKMFSGMTQKQQREREDCRHILPPAAGLQQQDNTPIELFSGDIAIVKQTLSAGNTPNQRNAEGDTPLHLAVVKHQSPELVRLLLENKADLKMLTQGYTPLQAACLFSPKCIVPLLAASLDKGLISGERTFAMNDSLVIPRIYHEEREGLLCTLCRETYSAQDMPVLLPCFHQMFCSKCLADAEKHQYKEWYRYNSFQPFRCYLCQSLTRNMVDYSTGNIEYIAKLRRRLKLGESWRQFYEDDPAGDINWPAGYQTRVK